MTESVLDLQICSTCGVQYSTAIQPSSCKICDDPRQYVPVTGQSWTTLRTLQSSQTYHNEFTPDEHNPDLIAIRTVPKVGIGQRAFLCRGPATNTASPDKGSTINETNNILWDCITYIDAATIEHINKLGGIKAIVISHPHYFSTSLYWAETFKCPVYISAEDEEWVMRKGGEGPLQGLQRFWGRGRLLFSFPSGSGGDGDGVDVVEAGTGSGSEESDTNAKADFVAIKTGGHFPGSSVLWWKSARKLLVADTIMVVPSGAYHIDREPGTTSFSFMWSYPNFIPLPPDEVHNIWKSIKDTDFEDTHGAFVGQDTRGDSKKRVLDSAKIIVRAIGYLEHAIHGEVV